MSRYSLKDRFLWDTAWPGIQQAKHRYLWMPFGISPAPECFQQKLNQDVEGLEGIYKVQVAQARTKPWKTMMPLYITPVSRRSRVRIPLKPWFFQASSSQLLKLENLLWWSFFTLLKLLERCRERNLKLNRGKLQLKCTETPFIGHVQTPEGIKPDPRMVEAVLKVERPSDVAAVWRLVGWLVSQLLVKKVSKETFKAVWTTKITHS